MRVVIFEMQTTTYSQGKKAGVTLSLLLMCSNALRCEKPAMAVCYLMFCHLNVHFFCSYRHLSACDYTVEVLLTGPDFYCKLGLHLVLPGAELL